VSARLREVIDHKRIVVCVGSGGVGKTTTAASIAVRAASEGRKTLVLTIDPARRLASSLGLEELGNEERLVPPEKFARADLPLRGELFAMMLDTKHTFDGLVERYAPDPATRDRILKNRLYTALSGSLAGSQEYMAMEKLYEVSRERDYDLIVLDTPPTANALDFLDAPTRMINMLDTPVLRGLPKVAGAFSKKAFFGSGLIMNALGKFTGVDFFQALAEFLANFTEMFDGFKERAQKVYEGLKQPEVGFVLVTSPAHATISEALFFHDKLVAARMPFEGFIINQVHAARGSCDAARIDALLERLYEDRELRTIPRDNLHALLQKLCRNLAEAELLAERDRASIGRLRERGGTSPFYVEVPRFHHDIFDLGGLALVARHLFQDGDARAASPALPTT
jgi:anion-transporting  ArsA/GET3 family ATPase